MLLKRQLLLSWMYIRFRCWDIRPHLVETDQLLCSHISSICSFNLFTLISYFITDSIHWYSICVLYLYTTFYLPLGTNDLKGHPIVTVDAEFVLTAGLNCYEIATVLLYYSTIPERWVKSRAHLQFAPKCVELLNVCHYQEIFEGKTTWQLEGLQKLMSRKSIAINAKQNYH